jgi:hypothetical protein
MLVVLKNVLKKDAQNAEEKAARCVKEKPNAEEKAAESLEKRDAVNL